MIASETVSLRVKAAVETNHFGEGRGDWREYLLQEVLDLEISVMTKVATEQYYQSVPEIIHFVCWNNVV